MPEHQSPEKGLVESVHVTPWIVRGYADGGPPKVVRYEILGVDTEWPVVATVRVYEKQSAFCWSVSPFGPDSYGRTNSLLEAIQQVDLRLLTASEYQRLYEGKKDLDKQVWENYRAACRTKDLLGMNTF